MAATDPGLAQVRMYECRWISGRKEGVCWIRGVSEDDVIDEFQRNASWYGAPKQRAFVVTVLPVERAEWRLSHAARPAA